LKAKEPVKTEQEKKQSELIDLFDEYSENLIKAQNKLLIMSELSFAPHDCDITLDKLYGTICEIDEHVQAMSEKAARAFEIAGLTKEQIGTKDHPADHIS
jgi:hypothetical protein